MSQTSLEARRRTVSRVALYGSLCLTAALAGLLLNLASSPLSKEVEVRWDGVDYASMPAVQLLRDYIRIDTTEATGSSLEGARFLARHLERAGIEPHLERVGEKDANLWAVIEGKGRGAVVLHSHIDVDDVGDLSAWPHPPFEAHIDLPWIYGRGAFDMKSIAVAQMLAFLDLARSGETPERSVILLATADEETGSELGVRWLLREHPELAERFDVVITEGGIVEAWTGDEIKYWGTEIAQKAYWTLIACDPSRERLERLKEDLVPFGASEPDLTLLDPVREFLTVYGATRDAAPLRQALADPERILRDQALFADLPAYVKSLFRNELHAGSVRPADGGGWELPVHVHLLPGVDLADVRAELIPEWLFYGVETTVYPEPVVKRPSPLDHWAMKAIEATLREDRPGVPIGPLVLPWTATDARFFRARGIPSYGFSPFVVLTSDSLRVSTAYERLALPEYVAGIDLYRHLLHRLVD